MKLLREHELEHHEPEFEPVYIVLESQKEVDLFYGIFSYTPLLDCLRHDIDNLVTKLFNELRSVGTAGYRAYLNKINSNLERRHEE